MIASEIDSLFCAAHAPIDFSYESCTNVIVHAIEERCQHTPTETVTRGARASIAAFVESQRVRSLALEFRSAVTESSTGMSRRVLAGESG